MSVQFINRQQLLSTSSSSCNTLHATAAFHEKQNIVSMNRRHIAVLPVGVVTGIPHLRTATSSKQQRTIYWNNCQETIHPIYCNADRVTESGVGVILHSVR